MYQYFRFTVFHFEMWNKLSLFTQREILQNITMANTNNKKWFDTILWSSWCWDFKFILVFNKYLHICRKVQIVFIWVIDRAPEIYVGVCSHDRQNKSNNLILIGFMKKKHASIFHVISNINQNTNWNINGSNVLPMNWTINLV